MDHNAILWRIGADIASATAILGGMVGWIPYLCAIPGALWYCSLLYDKYVLKRRVK